MLLRLGVFLGYCFVSVIVWFVCMRLAKRRGHVLPHPALVLVAVLVCGVLCQGVVQALPQTTEEVKIASLDLQGQRHKGSEVEVVDATVDNQGWQFNKLKQGSWIATTRGFKWYPPSKITNGFLQTDAIVLDIPAGQKREIRFKKTKKGGIARIELGDASYIIDTSQASRIEVQPSSESVLLAQTLCHMAVYAILLACLLVVFQCLYSYYVVGGKRQTWPLYLLLSFASFALLVRYSQGHAFWLDEMYQVGYSGCHNTLYQTLMVGETSPPLFRLLANLWYNMVPYGEEWLLLLGEIMCACTVYVGGMLCEKAMGRRAGIIGASFLCVSSTIASSAAYEFRPYSLLLLLSFALTYVFMDMVREAGFGWRKAVAYTLLMVAIAYTHYFGLLLCGVFFILLVFLATAKKMSKRYVLAYPILFVAYLPWVMRFLSMGHIELSATWMDEPSLYSMFNMISFLCNENVFSMLLFFVGAFVVCARLLLNKRDRNEKHVAVTAQVCVALLTCVLTITIVYCYGTMINPTAPLWVSRYFIVLLPHVTLLIASGVMAIISFLDKGLSSKVPSGRSILTVAVCCAFALQSFPVIAKSQETNEHIFDHFKPAAEWLCEQDNVLTKGSCIIVSDFKENATNGWAEYYLNKQGQRSYINVTSYAELVGPNGPEEFDMEEFYQTYKHVYRFCRIGMQNKDFDRLLEGSYTQTGGAENLCILEYKRVKR